MRLKDHNKSFNSVSITEDKKEVSIVVIANTVYSYLGGPCSLLIIFLCM